MHITNWFCVRGAVFAAAAAVAATVATPAEASVVQSGVFIGFETAPTNMTLYPITNPSPLCATYNPTGGSPLSETLTITDAGDLGTGTITFTDSSTSYDASPLGTFPYNSNCLTTAQAVPGSISISIGTTNCTGSGSYERVQSAVTITGTCSTGGTVSVTAVGLEYPCLGPAAIACTGSTEDSDLYGTYHLS